MSGRIRRDEVLRYLGYAGQVMSDDLDARVDQVVARCEADLRPKGCFRVYPIHRETDEDGMPFVAVEGTTLRFEGIDISEYLQDATHCALMACTVGMESEQIIRRLNATDPLDALIYGSACIDLVERGADEVEASVVAYAHERGLFTNYRYSPGYGDFDLAIQSAFIDVLQAGKLLGITVTDQNMLVPMKSITAVVGLYPHRPPEAKLGCGQCNCREYCTIRAAGQRCFSGKIRVDDAQDGPLRARVCSDAQGDDATAPADAQRGIAR